MNVLTALGLFFARLFGLLPAADPTLGPIASLVLKHNKAQILMPAGLQAARGSYLHHIDAGQAQQIGDQVQAACNNAAIPVAYVLASLAIESAFDPDACQRNLFGSNKENDPAGYDMGIAQLKIRYLLGLQGVKTVGDAEGFALDVTRAIPYAVRAISGKLAWASSVIPTFGSDVRVEFHSPYYLAAAAYNFGEGKPGATGTEGGALLIATDPEKYGNPAIFDAQGRPKHCVTVVELERQFAKTLGATSVFGDLVTV